MGEITTLAQQAAQIEVISVLCRDNPTARIDYVTMYADAVLDYVAASANIHTHGSVVLHPRTGAPIDNPYLRIRTAAISQMASAKGIRVVIGAWEVARGEA